MSSFGELSDTKSRLLAIMNEFGVLGTIIIAPEGFNCSVSGPSAAVKNVVAAIEGVLQTKLQLKSSFHESTPFRKAEVKIKPEIVTLKKQIDISLGNGTHVSPSAWNEIISKENTLVLDTRNDYEFRVGTFQGAVNPKTEKFSDLPAFVSEHLVDHRDKTIAIFCTGGIRCEKFAPYLRQIGFENVVQLEGGILRYLEETSVGNSKWDGECFVFDERRTVNERLEQGSLPDYSVAVRGDDDIKQGAS